MAEIGQVGGRKPRAGCVIDADSRYRGVGFPQRQGNEGFGEGPFQALFESIEREQMKRGVL